MSEHTMQAVTIAINTAVSSQIDVGPYVPRGISVITAAAWTAADITVEATPDGVTWYPLTLSDCAEYARITNVPTAASVWTGIPAEAWFAMPACAIRLRSTNTASTAAVNQAAARTLYVGLLR